MSLPKSPSNAAPLFDHLAHWGEVSSYEVEDLGVTSWVSVFEESGALEAIHDKGQPVSWHLTPRFVELLNRDPQTVGRRLCFAVPAYRAYLLGILAEGLVGAARAGMTVELEEWTRTELAALLPELNSFFGGLESDKRLVDIALPELEIRMAELPARRATSFDGWDMYALGHSARPKVLFEFALRRFAPSSVELPAVNNPVAVLRMLPLNREDGFSLGQSSLPQAWNTQRHHIRSGAAVVDPHGQLMFDEDAPLADVLVEHLRDALVDHPFYAAVVHLGISSWRSPASTMPAVELYVPPAGALHDASILVGARGVGRLADLLDDLVRAQGYAPFGLVNGRVADDLMGNLLRNLLDLRILRQRDELLVLDEDYQSSLMAARLRSVFRPGKELQMRIVEDLAARTSEGGAA